MFGRPIVDNRQPLDPRNAFLANIQSKRAHHKANGLVGRVGQLQACFRTNNGAMANAGMSRSVSESVTGGITHDTSEDIPVFRSLGCMEQAIQNGDHEQVNEMLSKIESVLPDASNRVVENFDNLKAQPSEDSCAEVFKTYEAYEKAASAIAEKTSKVIVEAVDKYPEKCSLFSSELDRIQQLTATQSEHAALDDDLFGDDKHWFVYYMAMKRLENTKIFDAILSSVSTKLTEATESQTTQDDCPVCLDAINRGEEKHHTQPCGHLVCNDCWSGWLDACLSSGRTTGICPLCRGGHISVDEVVAERLAASQHRVVVDPMQPADTRDDFPVVEEDEPMYRDGNRSLQRLDAFPGDLYRVVNL